MSFQIIPDGNREKKRREMVMTKFRMALPVLAAAAGLLVPTGVASAATTAPAHPEVTAPAASTPDVCNFGDVCMYTKNGWLAGRPEHIYSHDGCYVLHNEFGIRFIQNLETDGDKAKGYTSGNCSGTRVWVVPPFSYKRVHIFRINSIRVG